MKIDQKLKLNVLVVLSLLTVIVGVAIYYFDRIQRDVRQLIEIEEPLQRTALQMEINVLDTARTVLDYTRTLKGRNLESIEAAKLNFEQYAKVFLQLAETEQERALGRQVIEHYQKFKIMSGQITSMAKQRFDKLAVFKGNVATIHGLIGGELMPAIDGSAAEGMRKTHATLEMQVYIFKTFALIEDYILNPDPASKPTIAETEAGFQRFEAQYRATSLSARETQWLSQVATTFADAVISGNAIIALTDKLGETLAAFEGTLIEIDRILDDDIQVLILAEAQHAAKDATDSSQLAIAVITGLGIVIFITMASVNWVVLQGIVTGVARLSQGVAAFAGGNLSHRIDTDSNDELGKLASAFNEMAARRQVDEMAQIDSEQRITAIVDHIFDGIVTIDAAGIIQWTNRAALELFGYESDALIGRNVSILVPQPFAGDHDGFIRNYLETGQAKIIGIGREVEGQRSDGSKFPMELQIAAIQFKGKQLFLGVTRDITERKEMDRLKSEFVSTVSHELRTPLTSIRGALGLVSSGAFGELPEKAARMVELGKKMPSG
jgi:PAS domain S-box-containing protein